MQVDLQTSSIRPGDGASWRAALRERVRAEVASTHADVTIHVGNWYHDVRQVINEMKFSLTFSDGHAVAHTRTQT